MIVLDTNAVSELMRGAPHPAFLAWFLRQDPGLLRVTAVTVGEVRYGLARMPRGRRRAELTAAADRVFLSLAEQVIPFDQSAAEAYGPLLAAREARGRPMGTADAQIAAICLRNGAALATRNRADFEDTAVELIDPWGDAP